MGTYALDTQKLLIALSAFMKEHKDQKKKPNWHWPCNAKNERQHAKHVKLLIT